LVGNASFLAHDGELRASLLQSLTA
jgi:hypothetical protein